MLDDALKRLAERTSNWIAGMPLFAIGVIAFVGLMLLSKPAMRTLRKSLGRTTEDATTVAAIVRVTRLGWIVVSALLAASVAFPGLSLNAVVTTLGLGSVAVGFAFKDVLENIFAGFSILLTRPFRIGDTIEVQGRRGLVSKVDSRCTVIELASREVLLIPNAVLFKEPVVVVTRIPVRRFETAFPLDPSTDLSLAVAAALHAARDPGILEDPAPSVTLEQVGDGLIHAKLLFWIDTIRQDPVLTQTTVIEKLHAEFKAAGIRTAQAAPSVASPLT